MLKSSITKPQSYSVTISNVAIANSAVASTCLAYETDSAILAQAILWFKADAWLHALAAFLLGFAKISFVKIPIDTETRPA